MWMKILWDDLRNGINWLGDYFIGEVNKRYTYFLCKGLLRGGGLPLIDIIKVWASSFLLCKKVYERKIYSTKEADTGGNERRKLIIHLMCKTRGILRFFCIAFLFFKIIIKLYQFPFSFCPSSFPCTTPCSFWIHVSFFTNHHNTTYVFMYIYNP